MYIIYRHQYVQNIRQHVHPASIRHKISKLFTKLKGTSRHCISVRVHYSFPAAIYCLLLLLLIAAIITLPYLLQLAIFRAIVIVYQLQHFCICQLGVAHCTWMGSRPQVTHRSTQPKHNNKSSSALSTFLAPTHTHTHTRARPRERTWVQCTALAIIGSMEVRIPSASASTQYSLCGRSLLNCIETHTHTHQETREFEYFWLLLCGRKRYQRRFAWVYCPLPPPSPAVAATWLTFEWEIICFNKKWK